MKIVHLGCVVGGLVVGTGLGWAWASAGRAEPVGPDPVAARPAALPVATAPVAAKPAPPREGLRSAEAETLNRLEVLRWLIGDKERRQMLNLRVFAWAPRDEGKLDPGFVAVFGLTAAETARLEAAVATVRHELDEQAAAAAQVTVAPDNAHAQVLIPPQPQQGGRAYDELLGAFTETLGPERAACFSAIAGDSFDNSFHAFGAGERRIKLERITRPSGEVRLVVNENGAVPGGDSSWSANDEVTYSDFAVRFPMLAKVLPAAFATAPAKP